MQPNDKFTVRYTNHMAYCLFISVLVIKIMLHNVFLWSTIVLIWQGGTPRHWLNVVTFVLCPRGQRFYIPLGHQTRTYYIQQAWLLKLWVCNEFSVQMHPLTKGFLCFKKSEKMKEKQQKCAVTYKLLQSDLQILSVFMPAEYCLEKSRKLKNKIK